MTIDWGFVAVGCAGALLPDLIRIAKNRYDPGLPAYLKSPNFLLGLLVLIILGGIAAIVVQPMTWHAALAYGYAAPELISRALSERTPKGGGGASPLGGGGSPLLSWWRR